MKRSSVNPFTAFCRKAFDFLEESGVRYLVIGGLAVGVVGEARTTGDVDVVGFTSPESAEALIAKAMAAGFDVRPEIERERLHATGALRFRHGPFQLDIIPVTVGGCAGCAKQTWRCRRAPMSNPAFA